MLQDLQKYKDLPNEEDIGDEYQDFMNERAN